MYDKSKKTWSQRLKITKSEKSTTTDTASVTTPTTPTTSIYQQQQQHLLAKANNAAYINRSAQATPTTPTTPSPTAVAMHLPTAATTLNEFHGSSGYDFSPSALSRSMKYAEPWIYGTVRGMPSGTRPYHYQANNALQHGYMMQHSAFFAHPMATSELAIVICSCPEYLNGTKRDMKKASVCKKCKGSRLPLAPIGGTVRLRPNSTPLTLKARSSGAATMRVVSSGKKSRPTILDPQQDPYDLMRRSRLLSPEPSTTSKLVSTPSSASKSSDKARNRGKSESPSRGRSRTRPNLPLPLPTSKTKKSDLKSTHLASNNTASFSDCWLVEEPPALNIAYGPKTSNGTSTTSAARRSILRCNVNPYDLISSKSTNTSTSSSSSTSASNSSTPTTINPALTAATSTTPTTTTSMPNTPSPRTSHKMRSPNEFKAPKQDEFDVADAKLYDEAPPFLTRGHSQSKSQSNKNKPSGNINHGRATQQLNEKDVKSSSENVADDGDDNDDDDNDSDNDAPAKNKSSKKNNNSSSSKKSYTNVKAIAGQRISLGETNRTTKKSLIKQSEDGRIYESIIIAGDEEEEEEGEHGDEDDNIEDDDVVLMAVDVSVGSDKRRNSADSISSGPKLKLDLEQQPQRPPRNNARKTEFDEEATNSTTTTTAATNHKRQQQQIHVAAHNKQLPHIVATTPAIKSILKRPTSLLKENEGTTTTTITTTKLNTETASNSSQDNTTSATRHNRRQQARAAKKELIEHYNSSSTAAITTTSVTATTIAMPTTPTTTTPTATATFYIPLPQARKKVQFMVEDRIIQPDDNVDNSDTDNNDNERNIVVVAASDEDEVEFDEVASATTTTATAATTKSLNYEYYERKREQLKAMQQQQQQQQLQQQQINTATAANPCGQQPAGKCSNLAIETAAAAATVATSKSTLSGLFEPQQLNDDDDDDNNKLVTTTTTSKIPTKVAIKATTTTATNQHTATAMATLEHESNLVSSTLSAIDAGNNKSNDKNKSKAACSNKPADNNVLQHVAADVPAHSSSSSSNSTANATNYEVAAVRKDIIKDATAIDAESNPLLPTSMQQTQSDDFDVSAVAKQPADPEQPSTQPPQQLQLLPAAETGLLLSRNPIRRSHSERHSAYNKLTNGCNNDAKTNNNLTMTNNNNAAIFYFKDTMALRMKNVRSDSRDLFASNSMATAMTLLSSVRPREPPPPPPPTFAALTATATAITAATNTTAKVCTKQKSSSSPLPLPSPTTTLRRSSLSSLSLGNVVAAAETLSPAGQHEQNAEHKNKDATARNAKLSTNGLENHANEKQQQARPQQQQLATPRHVVVVAADTTASTTAESVTQATATATNNNDNDNENQSNSSNNKGASCQAINRPTSSADNNKQVEAPSTTLLNSSAPTTSAEHQPSVNHNSIPTSPRRNKSHNNNYGLFVKTSTTLTTSPKPERTVVRVAPFNKTSSEIHRLKINHTDMDPSTTGNSNSSNSDYNYDNDYFWRHSPSSPAYGDLSDLELSPFQAQKKTSILINGDDCYSTMNLSHDASTPLYQSSVVVADYSATSGSSLTPSSVSQQQQFPQFEGLRVSATTNTVTINVSSSPRRTPEEELIYQNNQINSYLSRQAVGGGGRLGAGIAIIPINGSAESVSLQRSASSTSSASVASSSSGASTGSNNGNNNNAKRGRTLIKLDYDKDRQQQQQELDAAGKELNQANGNVVAAKTTTPLTAVSSSNELFSHEAELVKILRNPVEAVRRNLVPHVCGKNEPKQVENQRSKKMTSSNTSSTSSKELSTPSVVETSTQNLLTISAKSVDRNSFIAKLLEDPTLNQVAEGLESETIVQLIENSLKRLKESRSALDTSGTKDNDDMMRLIDLSLEKLQEERQQSMTQATTPTSASALAPPPKDGAEGDGRSSNRGSISSVTSFSSAHNYEMFEFDTKSESDCYQSCSSEITSPGDDEPANDAAVATKRSKFYQMLVDATLAEIELSTGMEDAEDVEHHYESIRQSGDPIYEEISDMPPPLPLSAPPLNDAELDKKVARSMFEGASKYEILSYLVDAKQRGVVREEPAFEYPVNCSNPIIIEEEAVDTLSDLGKRKQKSDARDNSSSRASIMSDSSEDNQSTMSSLSPPPAHSFLGGANGLLYRSKGNAAEIERNDSGVGSETSKSSRSKYQHPLTGTTTSMLLHKNSPIHLCEDCDGPVETQVTDSGVMFAPLVCRKCGKKRAERKEIITEIVETEEKYGRDLQIVLEEFCQPMLVAGLLTQEQLSAIFLNTEDLLENNQTLAERMRDALDIALEQGDDDLLTVNIGRIFLDFTQMLHAFESYCVRQAGASLLLANLEKEKELLRIFLKVSQMENTVLRRMNLNSFLMVPVQRVTKYPLLLARLYKVTPAHLDGRDLLKQAQEKIELHLNHINQEAKDVPTKLWRRISSSSPNRRASCEIDMINIKLRKMAIDVLEWNHDEVRFAMEGKLLFTQPTDSNWKKARTIKLTPVNALLVTNGKPSGNYKAEKVMSDKLNFPKHTGVREASLLLVKEKCGRYTLIREPLYLDRCVVCSEADWDDYFEVQEISSKDTFIFKAEDGVRTKQWYTQLQYHAQGMGAWRKRRNALANIMINGMLARS